MNIFVAMLPVFWDSSLCNGFVLISLISNNINEYANKKISIKEHKIKYLSNCITGEIKTCNNGGLMMVWV